MEFVSLNTKNVCPACMTPIEVRSEVRVANHWQIFA
jgi:hypothetical protein